MKQIQLGLLCLLLQAALCANLYADSNAPVDLVTETGTLKWTPPPVTIKPGDRDLDDQPLIPLSIGHGKALYDQIPVPPAKSDPDWEPKACLDAASKAGKPAWLRGFEQALSGQRFLVWVRSQEFKKNSSLKSCSEYPASDPDNNEHACCMAGYREGYLQLQALLMDHVEHSKKALKSQDAQACFHAFDEGLQQGHHACVRLEHDKSACQNIEVISKEDLGCVSMGYTAALAHCKALPHDFRGDVNFVLNSGALSGRKSKKALESFETELPPVKDPASASGAQENAP